MSVSYPWFIPPPELAGRTAEQWSKAEAKTFLEWQLRVIEPRVAQMLRYLNDDASGSRKELLLRLGEKVAAILPAKGYSIEPDRQSTETGTGPASREAILCARDYRRLTETGMALASDLGLLLAKLVLEDCGGAVRWDVLRKPKSALAYNLPVLVGLKKYPGQHVEPIRVSIANGSALVRGEGSPDAWWRAYEAFIKDAGCKES